MKMGKIKNRINQNIKCKVTLLTVYEIITKYVKKLWTVNGCGYLLYNVEVK